MQEQNILTIASKGRNRAVVKAAINMSLSEERNEEKLLAFNYKERNILATAVDYGGNFSQAVSRIIERAVVAAKREGLIDGSHTEEGAVAGATHEALSRLMDKAYGLNVGGKIGIARCEDLLSVSIFLSVGLLHLDEVVIAIGNRVI